MHSLPCDCFLPCILHSTHRAHKVPAEAVRPSCQHLALIAALLCYQLSILACPTRPCAIEHELQHDATLSTPIPDESIEPAAEAMLPCCMPISMLKPIRPAAGHTCKACGQGVALLGCGVPAACVRLSGQGRPRRRHCPPQRSFAGGDFNVRVLDGRNVRVYKLWLARARHLLSPALALYHRLARAGSALTALLVSWLLRDGWLHGCCNARCCRLHPT